MARGVPGALLASACAVIGLFCREADNRALRPIYKLVQGWALQPQPEIESITTVANSVLCSDSVGAYGRNPATPQAIQ